jgi:lipid A ethanolaminephosphotransferase
MPSLWAYARKAGFHTVYIDAQRTGGELQNLMDEAEKGFIDSFVQFDDVPVQRRDMAAADRLASLTRNGRADFVMVNKVGAHFPIHDKYPDGWMRHRPALPRGAFEDVSDTGNRDGFGGTAEDWRRYRNSYRNTLLWNVGAFFDRLFARADLSNVTLIYTSDHGQDLHERGNAGLDTHCSATPVPEEGLVPLVVIEGAGLDTLGWDVNFASNRNRVSHYQLFPTLLALMGYDPEEVRPIYGESLIPPSRDPVTFNILFNARLGRDPVWQPIDLAKIALPPPGDSLRR